LKSLPICLEVPEFLTDFHSFTSSFEDEDGNGGILDADGNPNTWRKP